jgi:hypothetical protein
MIGFPMQTIFLLLEESWYDYKTGKTEEFKNYDASGTMEFLGDYWRYFTKKQVKASPDL